MRIPEAQILDEIDRLTKQDLTMGIPIILKGAKKKISMPLVSLFMSVPI